MASKRDLVEAHAFNRRRLTTAFLSGAPGGREVEPARYGRPLIGGLVLALILVAGAAVAGVLKPTVDKDWLQDGMVVAKDSGSRFAAFEGTLYPVINTTSARLALASDGKLSITYVPDKLIAKQDLGVTVGIPGAPDSLPDSSQLVQSGWTACTNSERGVKLRIASKPAADSVDDGAIVVSSAADKKLYVVAGSHRYPLPSGSEGVDVLRVFGLDTAKPYPVPAAWLDLITPGKELNAFTVPGAGETVSTQNDGLDTAGTPVRVDGRGYVLTKEGLLPLSPFAYAIYRSSSAADGLDEQQLNAGETSGLDTITAPSKQPYPQSWPEEEIVPFTGSDPCLLLKPGTETGDVSTAVLARSTSNEAVPPGGQNTTEVQAGHGALVRAATTRTADATTSLFLIDQLGSRYAIGEKGKIESAKTALGYNKVQFAAVPQNWTALFEDGPALTRAAGGKPANQ